MVLLAEHYVLFITFVQNGLLVLIFDEETEGYNTLYAVDLVTDYIIQVTVQGVL